MRFWGGVLAATAVALALAGCGGESDASLTNEPDSAIAHALDEARDADASAEQIEELTDALASGSVDLEVSRTATHRAVECIQAAGYFAEYGEDRVNGGHVVPTITWQTDGEAVADQCERTESYWVNFVYQTQPSTIEAFDAYFEQQRPILTACLARFGVDVAADADIYEVLNLAAQRQLDAAGGEGNCLEEASIDGF